MPKLRRHARESRHTCVPSENVLGGFKGPHPVLVRRPARSCIFELEQELERELQRTPESSRQGTRPHLMGASSSTLEIDMDSVFAMEGAAKMSNERPWGSDNVHLSDVALHVSIVL